MWARKTDELGDLLEELVPSLLPLGVLVVRNASFALPLGLADENARRCAFGSGSLTQLLPSRRAETQVSQNATSVGDDPTARDVLGENPAVLDTGLLGEDGKVREDVDGGDVGCEQEKTLLSLSE